MATMYYDKDADLALIRGQEGRDHRLRIAGPRARAEPEGQRRRRRASGCRPTSRSRAKARGRRPDGRRASAEAAEWADVIMMLVARHERSRRSTRDEIAPHLAPGKMLMFAHGFNIRFGTIAPPPDVDVTMIAPKAPGHRVREVFVEGAGTPGAAGRPPGRHRPGARARAVVRQGHRRHARRRHRDDVRRGDRDRSLRRAGGAVRRRRARSSRPASRRWSRPATSPRSPTSSACTS